MNKKNKEMNAIIYEKNDARLTEEEIGSPGCGVNTPTQCFALNVNPESKICLMISDKESATEAGINLDWRKNIDPKDGRPWCPKQILTKSKMPHVIWIYRIIQGEKTNYSTA
jgi:hypothetical protein